MANLFPGQFSPIPNSFEQLSTALSAPTPLTVPKGARYALIQAHTHNVWWTDDGSIPSSTNGFVLAPDVEPQGFVGDLSTLQFLESTSGASLSVGYYQ